MDQNQALNLLDHLISQQELTRTQHEQAKMAIQLLRQMGKQFTDLVLEKREAEAKQKAAPALPKKNPDVPKPIVDNGDKSQA